MREIVLALPGGSSGDWLRSLSDYLSYEDELRGQLRLIEGGPVRETLSSGLVEALAVGLSSGGAFTVLASGLISWLRQLAPQATQPVPAEVTLTLPSGGSFTIKTSVARAWTQAELEWQVDRLVQQLSGADPADAG
jgi:Effector Associated Constant Component 1